VVLAAIAGYYSVLLYKNLRPDLEELLPTTARSVQDLDEVTRRLDSIDNLAILVFSKNTQASKRFVDDLAGKLEQAPKSVLASIEYKIDRELQFFKERRILYMDLDDLLKIRNHIRDKIEYEKKIRNPLNIFANNYIPQPTLDFKALQKKYESKVSSYSRFPDGYYATPDQTKRVVLAYLAGRSSGIAQLTKLKQTVEDSVEQLNPKSYASDLTVYYTGGVQNTLEEQFALVRDLEVSTGIVVVIVTLAMLIFFRAVRATFALLLSLFVGTLWTFGVAYFVVGYLNANSAFLGSIVIGNGINFGIIFLARYMEERRNQHNHLRSTFLSMSHTATATWTAALAAGLSYGSLVLTGFRGFKQFGIIGLIGMILCWISAFIVLPAFLTVLDSIKSLNSRKRKPKSYLAEATAKFVSARPAAIWAFSFILTILSISMFFRFSIDKVLETNLAKLRSKQSMESGSAYLSQHVDEIFQRYLSPLAVLPKDREEAKEIAASLKRLRETEGKRSLISAVQTLDDFIAQDQPQKIAVLYEIKSLLPPRILKRLGPDERNIIDEFLNAKSMRPVLLKEMPPLILTKFTEKDKSVGKLVLVEPPLDSTNWEGEKLIRFVSSIRNTADAVAPGTAVAGGLPITADMVQSIIRDGPRATAFAFMAVVLLVVFLFRNGKTISLVLFSLVLGVVWLAGAILAFDIKINFVNFIALPITFGIGVDYGVNIFQRYRQEGSGSILKVIRDTGGAVGLCSFTTIVGYGSLLIADNQAFVSFGLLAVLGEVTCLVAAIIALPAYLSIHDKKRREQAT